MEYYKVSKYYLLKIIDILETYYDNIMYGRDSAYEIINIGELEEVIKLIHKILYSQENKNNIHLRSKI